ncbi:MAG: imidazole glycerol phosphate synthase subunit HisH [Alphaproteobacteria bacterium]|nr:imidazole glycerol phosphate synthase subunit HisH [Alphaproteobacteria bacterium]
MSAPVVIVDYGMGNIASVRNALAALGVPASLSSDRMDLAAAEAIVLPGVGAFGEAMANLHSLDLVGPLTEQVVGNAKPFLGICLGMQLIAERSEEQGDHEGLGWIPGAVVPIPPRDGFAVPHVGWSELAFGPDDPAFARLDRESCFYFDHSFTLRTESGLVRATADYGVPLTAVVGRANIIATQFHPEKSQRSGLKFLRNFTNRFAARQAA